MREHWLLHAHGRIVAGDDELDVLADYGWLRLTAEEREAIEASREFWQVESECYFADETDGRYAATLRKLLERLK